MNQFIGRELEYQRLTSFLANDSAAFIVIKGRRRVGKSTLVEHFGNEFSKFYTFTGLAPEKGIDANTQRQEFCRQFAHQFNCPAPKADDWGDIFWSVAERIKKGKVLLFLDEVSWMAQGDKTFLPKLKDAWDKYFKKNNRLILIVCASASSWINKNLLSSTSFVGRVSFVMNLKPLPLNVCKQFWQHTHISAYEKLKVISVTGGIPRYLEEVQSKLTAEDNIKRLCFTPGGLLVNEFEKIFHDLFLHESLFYQKIARLLSAGPKNFKTICDELELPQSGRISEYLYELEEAGFIQRDYSWSIKTAEESKISVYRLCDSYLRFYFKYIEKNRKKINDDKYAFQSLSQLSQWASMMGIQVENLIINNRDLLIKSLDLNPADIVADGPFLQKQTKRLTGCQIDYLIQTRLNTLYLVEIKFSKTEIKSSVIDEVKQKIKALRIPTGFSIRTVLIHVNGVNDSIEETGFFTHIVNVSDWLN